MMREAQRDIYFYLMLEVNYIFIGIIEIISILLNFLESRLFLKFNT